MANARFNSTKGNQRNSDQAYEGEQGMSGMGEMAKTGEAVSRDNTKGFGDRQDVNPMAGTGAKMPQQATYKVPTDNWRS